MGNFSGHTHTEESRRRMSEAHSGKPSPRKGMAWSQEFRQSLSNIMKEKGIVPTKQCLEAAVLVTRNKLRPIEVRRKISSTKIGHVVIQETRDRISKSKTGQHYHAGFGAAISLRRSGANHPFYGKKHTPETLIKLSISHKGKTLSEETKEKIAEASARQFSRYSFPRTKIERILYEKLEKAGYTYISQKPFGRYVVDAYLPLENVVVEADGSYWHNRPGSKEREAIRDAYLLNRFNISKVIHLEEQFLLNLGGEMWRI